jgi:hypothetical protein
MFAKAVVAFWNVPVPSVLQTPVVEAPLTLPLISTSRSSTHTTRSLPALDCDSGTMVNVIWSIALSQLFTLQVKVTVPFTASLGAMV